MKVLVIGSGGREHCLAWKLSHSKSVTKLYCAPGNGGTAGIAENVDIAAADIDKLLEFAITEKIGLTVVGPEAPLVAGIVDRFEASNLKVFGPSKDLARLEGSKIFAKELMQKYNIPTAGFKVFSDPVSAKEYINQKGAPLVIKADGLAAGKGVIVAATLDEAMAAVDMIMIAKKFGSAGDKLIVEDCLQGEELSVLIFTDGETIIPLASSQDHKRAFDGDKGPNTGGMGAYSPAPVISQERFQEIVEEVFRPLIDGLQKEGRPYKGILYAGLMIKDDQPMVLEFNVRFGDPETQVILPKLKSDLAEVMLKTVEGKLKGVNLDWDQRYCLCVVLASGGYPENYKKLQKISGWDKFDNSKDIFIFHAGTGLDQNNDLVTTGGRVLNVSALGVTIKEAKNKAYEAIESINFNNMFYRKDIDHRAVSGQ